MRGHHRLRPPAAVRKALPSAGTEFEGGGWWLQSRTLSPEEGILGAEKLGHKTKPPGHSPWLWWGCPRNNERLPGTMQEEKSRSRVVTSPPATFTSLSCSPFTLFFGPEPSAALLSTSPSSRVLSVNCETLETTWCPRRSGKGGSDPGEGE